MSDSTIIANQAAALADSAAANLILVRMVQTGGGTVEANVPEGSTLSQVLSVMGSSVSDKQSYVQRGVALAPDTVVKAADAPDGGPVIAARNGANGVA